MEHWRGIRRSFSVHRDRCRRAAIGRSRRPYPLARNGTPGSRRLFAKLAGYRQTPAGPRSGADGIAVDAAGRVFVATSAGVEVFGADGTALGILLIPNAPQNLAFGGPDRSKLYVVGRGSVYRIATLTRGVDRPGK